MNTVMIARPEMAESATAINTAPMIRSCLIGP
jgi:hypothetical protein